MTLRLRSASNLPSSASERTAGNHGRVGVAVESEIRFSITRFYLSARSRGWDYSHSIRYALDRAAEQLARSFK